MKNKVRVQRAIHDLTQLQLAEKIGVSRQTINAIESQKYVPSTALALKLAALFACTVEDIFELEEGD
jgi:putative transcriptional regulator